MSRFPDATASKYTVGGAATSTAVLSVRPSLARADTVTEPLCSSVTVTPLTAPAIAGVTVTSETTESAVDAPPRATSRIVEPRSRRPTVASCCPGAVPPPSPLQPMSAAIERRESRLRAWRAIDALGRDEKRNCRRTYPEQTVEHAV